MRTPRFLYPEEGLAKGSTLWFTMLLASCLRKEVFALALYVQRPWMRPHLVALVPQVEFLLYLLLWPLVELLFESVFMFAGGRT